jgi:hypothetical protein
MLVSQVLTSSGESVLTSPSPDLLSDDVSSWLLLSPYQFSSWLASGGPSTSTTSGPSSCHIMVSPPLSSSSSASLPSSDLSPSLPRSACCVVAPIPPPPVPPRSKRPRVGRQVQVQVRADLRGPVLYRKLTSL